MILAVNLKYFYSALLAGSILVGLKMSYPAKCQLSDSLGHLSLQFITAYLSEKEGKGWSHAEVLLITSFIVLLI